MNIVAFSDALRERRIRGLTNAAAAAFANGRKDLARALLARRDALILGRSPERVAAMEAKIRGVA